MTTYKIQIEIESALSADEALSCVESAMVAGLAPEDAIVLSLRDVTEAPDVSIVDSRMAAAMVLLRDLGGVAPSTGLWQIGMLAQQDADFKPLPSGRGVWYSVVERLKSRGLIQRIGSGLGLGHDDLANAWVFRYGRPSEYLAFTKLGKNVAAKAHEMLPTSVVDAYKRTITPELIGMMSLVRTQMRDGSEDVPEEKAPAAPRPPRAPRTPRG